MKTAFFTSLIFLNFFFFNAQSQTFCDAGFYISPDLIGLGVSFSHNFVYSGQRSMSFSYNFGDGHTEGQSCNFLSDMGSCITYSDVIQSVHHIYEDIGLYHICLTMEELTSDYEYCQETTCKYFYVAEAIPDCTVDFDMVQDTLTVFISDASSAADMIVAWQWDFGDGVTSTEQHPIHHYDLYGTYPICLTTTSSSGCETTDCKSVTLVGTCQPDFFIAVGGFYIYPISTSSGVGSITEEWEIAWCYRLFPDADYYCGSDNYLSVYGDGFYVVELCITDSLNCHKCVTESFDPPVLSCAIDFDYEISGLTIELQSLASYTWNSEFGEANFIIGGEEIQWDFGEGQGWTDCSEDITNICEHTYDSFGEYEVCLQFHEYNFGYYYQCSATADVLCQTIWVGDTVNCAAQFTTLLIDNELVLTNTSTGIGNLTYEWTFGDATTSTNAEPSHTFTTPGEYEVCLHLSTASGCSDQYCELILVFVSGVQNEDNIFAFTIFPNPVNDNLQIINTVPFTEPIEVRLYNIQGKLLKNTLITSPQEGQFVWSMEDFQSGIYVIAFQNTKGIVLGTERIVKW